MDWIGCNAYFSGKVRRAKLKELKRKNTPPDIIIIVIWLSYWDKQSPNNKVHLSSMFKIQHDIQLPSYFCDVGREDCVQWAAARHVRSLHRYTWGEEIWFTYGCRSLLFVVMSTNLLLQIYVVMPTTLPLQIYDCCDVYCSTSIYLCLL